jgi:hypothetical protein
VVIPLSLVFGLRTKGTEAILRDKYSSRFEDAYVSQNVLCTLSHGDVVLSNLFTSPLPYVGRGKRAWMSGMEDTAWDRATENDRKSPTEL